MRLIEQAGEYERMGYHPIPLASGSKSPLAGFPLAEHFQRNVPIAEISEWFYRAGNLGLVTGDLVVVDYDRNVEDARKFYRRLKGVLRTISLTKRGVHFLFKAPCPQFPSGNFEHGDLKASRGYVVEPRSVIDGWKYEFADGHGLVPFDELPVLQPDMVKVEPKQDSRTITRDTVRNAVAYVMTIESVQGRHGSKGLVRAAAVCREAGLTEAEATVVLIDWNNSGKAVPPWSLTELTRAISRTYAKGGK